MPRSLNLSSLGAKIKPPKLLPLDSPKTGKKFHLNRSNHFGGARRQTNNYKNVSKLYLSNSVQ